MNNEHTFKCEFTLRDEDGNVENVIGLLEKDSGVWLLSLPEIDGIDEDSWIPLIDYLRITRGSELQLIGFGVTEKILDYPELSNELTSFLGLFYDTHSLTTN